MSTLDMMEQMGVDSADPSMDIDPLTENGAWAQSRRPSAAARAKGVAPPATPSQLQSQTAPSRMPQQQAKSSQAQALAAQRERESRRRCRQSGTPEPHSPMQPASVAGAVAPATAARVATEVTAAKRVAAAIEQKKQTNAPKKEQDQPLELKKHNGEDFWDRMGLMMMKQGDTMEFCIMSELRVGDMNSRLVEEMRGQRCSLGNNDRKMQTTQEQVQAALSPASTGRPQGQQAPGSASSTPAGYQKDWRATHLILGGIPRTGQPSRRPSPSSLS